MFLFSKQKYEVKESVEEFQKKEVKGYTKSVGWT